jgi:formate-dependent nitrite reductase membrane component NrfD
MILINLVVDLMLLGIAATVIATIILYKRAEKQDLLEESNNSNWLNYKVKEV